VYAETGIDMTRSTVIPEVIAFEKTPAARIGYRRSVELNRHPWELTYVGRLIRAKGVDLLLDAVARLPTTAEVHLHIAGDGPEREALERQATQLGLANRITFHGWVLPDQLWRIYERADLFVHPARWPEPFGRTIIEALTFGLPTIVSDIGHPPSLVRDFGLTFRPGDSRDLARAIAHGIEEYGRLISATAAARSQVEQYHPSAVVDRLEEVYRSVL
jgi:glycosyltransferase involved in cell wall biosynthesis